MLVCIYLKIDDQKNTSYVDFNEDSVAPLTSVDRIVNIVVPYENSYAVIYNVSYATMEQRLATAKMQIGVIATLIVGNLGALFQDNIKRMLAYSSIAHAGYLLLGLFVGFNDGHFDPAVTRSVLFYLLGYSFVTLGAFGVLSVLVDDEKEAVTFLIATLAWLAILTTLVITSRLLTS